MRGWVYAFPPLAECRASFETLIDQRIEWPEPQRDWDVEGRASAEDEFADFPPSHTTHKRESVLRMAELKNAREFFVPPLVQPPKARLDARSACGTGICPTFHTYHPNFRQLATETTRAGCVPEGDRALFPPFFIQLLKKVYGRLDKPPRHRHFSCHPFENKVGQVGYKEKCPK